MVGRCVFCGGPGCAVQTITNSYIEVMPPVKELKVTKLQSMEVCEKECQQKVGRVRGKLEVLESELQQLAGERSSRENSANGISRNTILGEDAFSEYCENYREFC